MSCDNIRSPSEQNNKNKTAVLEGKLAALEAKVQN
jgi:hypothetical protein